MEFEAQPIASSELGRGLITNYGDWILDIVPKMTRRSHRIDQVLLRQCIGLSSSFLITDSTTDPEHGLTTWSSGFMRLIDITVALHSKNELELETMNVASQSCSECWSVAAGWRGLEPAREIIRKVAMKLKRLLDENGKTYHGERVYAP